MNPSFDGAFARANGVKLTENPYRNNPRSAEYRQWRTGWQRMDRAINRELGAILNAVAEIDVIARKAFRD